METSHVSSIKKFKSEPFMYSRKEHQEFYSTSKNVSMSACNCICEGQSSALSMFKKLQVFPGHASDKNIHKLTRNDIIQIDDFSITQT